MHKTVALVMAGGGGTRLWPLSTEAHPKQFLVVPGCGSHTLLGDALNRTYLMDHRFIITGRSLAESVWSDPEVRKCVPKDNIITEPCRKNTAAAVLLGLLTIKKRLGDHCIVMVMPSDHLIEEQSFTRELCHIWHRVGEDSEFIYTLGIEPSCPSTSYGYIEPSSSDHISSALQFVEKPTKDVAQSYMDRGFLWNSGIFLGRVDVFLRAFQEHMPDHYSDIDNALNVWEHVDYLLDLAYNSLKPISIDYGLMERHKKTKVVRVGFKWDDLGGWDAMDRHMSSFVGGKSNVNVITELDKQSQMHNTSHDNTVYSTEKDKKVYLVDVDNLLIVENGDTLMVANKNSVHKIKHLNKER